MDRLRVGIVGCGRAADLHARAVGKCGCAELAAVCDRDEETASRFGSRHSAQSFTDLTDMLAEAALDVCMICTPHPRHAEPALQALEGGVHVLIEKPMAPTLKECDAMINAADASGLKLGVVSQRRFYPAVQRVWNAVQEGRIGRPILGEVRMLGWRDRAYYDSDPWRGSWNGEGGGVLVNQAPHQLDILQWLMGPIEMLQGSWRNLNHPYIEVDDTAAAVLHFRNGGLGVVLVSNSQKPGLYGKVHIHGENGASVGVQTDSGAMFIAGMSEITEPPRNDLWTIPGEEALIEARNEEDARLFAEIDPTVYFHHLQDMDFFEAVIEDRKPLVDGREGRIAVEIFTAVYRSTRDLKPVRFPVENDDGMGDFDGRLQAG